MAIQFGNRLLLSKAKAFSSRNNAFFFSFFFFFTDSILDYRGKRAESRCGEHPSFMDRRCVSETHNWVSFLLLLLLFTWRSGSNVMNDDQFLSIA